MKMFIGFLFSILLVGCAVNDPVKTQSVLDDRPRITLDVKGYEAEHLELFIDGLTYGAASKYLNTLSALPIVPGNHVIEINQGTRNIYSTTEYYGEGTVTVIKVHAQ